MSISAISSSAATTTSSTTSTSSTSNSLSANDFLSLLAEQLQNQDPLNPTDTTQVMNQLMSFASYQQAAETNTTLSTMSSTLDAIASDLDISV